MRLLSSFVAGLALVAVLAGISIVKADATDDKEVAATVFKLCQTNEGQYKLVSSIASVVNGPKEAWVMLITGCSRAMMDAQTLSRGIQVEGKIDPNVLEEVSKCWTPDGRKLIMNQGRLKHGYTSERDQAGYVTGFCGGALIQAAKQPYKFVLVDII